MPTFFFVSLNSSSGIVKRNVNIMKKYVNFAVTIVAILSIISCGTVRYLPVSVSQKQSFSNYKYVYVDPYHSYGSYKYYGCDVVAGMLMKKGFIMLSYNQYINMPTSMAYSTMEVTYGEGGTRSVDIFGGFTREVTLQFVSAATKDIICVCTAEGMGKTASEDAEIAVRRCILKLFP